MIHVEMHRQNNFQKSNKCQGLLKLASGGSEGGD